MSDSSQAEHDELLAELLEGRCTPQDARVLARRASDPQWAARVDQALATRTRVEAAAETQREDLERARAMHADAAEERTLDGFRAQIRAARLQAASAAPIRASRAARRWMALASAAALVIVSALWWNSRAPAPDERYLGPGDAIFVHEPSPPFGSLRWNKSERAVTFEVRAWDAREHAEQGAAPRWIARDLTTTQFSLSVEQLAQCGPFLHWELRQFDAAGTEVSRASFSQQR